MSKLPLPFQKFSLYLSLLFLTSTPFNVISQITNTQEQSILLNIKQQLGNPPSLQSWTTSTSPCTWPEISCSDDGSVTALGLRDKNITVAIPARICDLKNLTVLDLAYNYIPGGFPTFLYNCSSLERLDLSQNYFVGTVPDDIDRLSNLKSIDLSANNFSGDIPPAIGNLRELQTLFLHQNEFNGTFPKEIGNLANLEQLRLAFNGFVPSRIPVEFGNLTKLTFLWIRDANLIGSIPESLANLSSLETLDLSINKLEGSIPDGLFLLKNLTYLYLFHNQLSGDMPKKVEALNLVEVDLGINNLIGSISEDFGKLKNLERLHLYSNQLSGELPQTIGLLPALKSFRVFTNNLSGVLPTEIGLHSKLQYFEVSTNHFSGKLPENLCAGGVLEGVVAFSNNLTGEVPQSLGKCNSLKTVQLYNNRFSGEIPSGIWTVINMTYLMLSNNSFSGKLPSSLAWNLSRLELSNNKFSGPIPTGISSWVNLVVFEASNNLLSGEIPVEVTSLSHLNTLLLDGNQLLGQLPSKIISWKTLNTLNLSRNALSGQIPAAIGSLPDLLYLDLSQNHLSGQIPSEFGQLNLISLNLSSNQFSGQIPDKFDNLAYENSFLNNSNLCAVNPILDLPNCYTRSRNSDKLSSKFLAMILIFTVTAFIITIVLTLFAVRDYLRKKHKRELAAWKLTSFQRVDFTQANILASLTESNLIGSGGSGKVYRVAVNRAGELVAVKRIWTNRQFDEKLEKEFLAEVEILGAIRHSNIVKLLCCISSEESKLLVYEYMENQSLDRWLHGKKRNSSLAGTNSVQDIVLNWPRRLQIAVGAAQGLCYMHHDCSPPIIHRDVKSSNILLDSEFKARIADFGLAKILVKEGEARTMSAVAGSFGYIAPEYAYTIKVNEKIDVYSFGVVLLELVTGREPNNGDENSSLAEWAWRQNAEGTPIIDCFDEEIRQPCYLEEMTAVFNLGLFCTSNMPNQRPSMKDVLQVLRRYSPTSYKENMGSEFDVAPLLASATYLSSYKHSKRVSDEYDCSLVYSV
ncbi:receptor-like protein kinase HSL1 [Ricinus communis]|uniref:Serine-threonine protein kinase, plant-type, putative n=1 Tax=Ricinus communis TaxID=3988 RepID=B9RS14_RICCO|nr:receptor-like protein kinase HSL1 [Ricinus communis]EEF45874.1 serine-threonine protein kinase, plant-type, putative [Ricinus communis]|eukprot:XP_002516533.1 receptor-like protein kinase HSL1 [Ricinus communis]